MARSRHLLGLSGALLIASGALAQTNARVSVGLAGAQANDASGNGSISADAGSIAFHSEATNLVAGDTNARSDVFVHDRSTGTTSRVSLGAAGAQGNHVSQNPSISADGRWVAFESNASDLVAGDANGFLDVFVHDRLTGTTEVVSVDASGAQPAGGFAASISGDGRYVAFASVANNIVPGDTNGPADIFVRDRQTGTTTRVNVTSAGTQANGMLSEEPSISADGRFVAFTSYSTNLVPADTNVSGDVFVHDLATGTTVRASVGAAGVQGNGFSFPGSISGDGRFVAFASGASNLVAGDTNGQADIFVRDLVAGTTTRASVSSSGAQTGTFPSDAPSISLDGRFVAFHSKAGQLSPNDDFGSEDVFVHDLQSGTTERASTSYSGWMTLSMSSKPSISGDGRYVVFESPGSNLVSSDTNGVIDVFLRDRETTFTTFCFGDGSVAPCPCGNDGPAGQGCHASTSTTLGASTTAGGNPSLSADSFAMTALGNMPGNLKIVLQGDAAIAPVAFGDGLRCVGGTLRRLYVVATFGVFVVPGPGDASISAQSALLGVPIAVGEARHYQVYYRDASTTFCPAPTGDTFNVTSGLSATWGL